MDVRLKLLRFVGLRRQKPKTRLGLVLRYVEWAIVFGGLFFLALHLYPQVLFAHSYSHGELTIYQRSKLPPEVADRTVEIADLVSRSELDVPGHRHRVFVCNDPWVFRLFTPIHSKSFAVSIVFTNNIFVADADLSSDLARSGRLRFNQRTFSGVAAHEIIHSLIRARLGRLQALTTEDWVKEGYADYIASESSFPEIQGLELLLSGRSDPSKSFQYFLWRKMVEHLVEGRGLTFEELVAMGGEPDRVEAEAIATLRTQQNLLGD